MIFLIIFLFTIPNYAQEAGDYTVEMLDRIEAINNPQKNKCLTSQTYSITVPFCQRDHAAYLNDENNQLNFTNDATETNKKNGLFNMGFCWWHNRLTLNAAYVAEFNRPDGLEINTAADAKKVIKMLRNGEHVKIKDFKNLKELSQKYDKFFREELDAWMLSDTVRFKWTNALKGQAQITNSELTQKIELLYSEINKSGPRFVSTQLKGFLTGSHSVIITKIEKETIQVTNSSDHKIVDQIVYKMTAVDSNKQHTQSILFMPDTNQSTLANGYYDAEEFANLPQLAYKTYLNGFYQKVQYKKQTNTANTFVPVEFNYVDREKIRLLETFKKACSK